MKRIEWIKTRSRIDESPDTSTLGVYTDDFEPGVIVRKLARYLEALPEGAILPNKGREYRCFRPYAGGEKVGTKEYYEYGMTDFERMEGLNSGQWSYIGIDAVACVSVSVDNGMTWKSDRLTSGGLWGIDSNSGEAYFKEVKGEELAALSTYLAEYGFTRLQIDEAMKEVSHTQQ